MSLSCLSLSIPSYHPSPPSHTSSMKLCMDLSYTSDWIMVVIWALHMYLSSIWDKWYVPLVSLTFHPSVVRDVSLTSLSLSISPLIISPVTDTSMKLWMDLPYTSGSHCSKMSLLYTSKEVQSLDERGFIGWAWLPDLLGLIFFYHVLPFFITFIPVKKENFP